MSFAGSTNILICLVLLLFHVVTSWKPHYYTQLSTSRSFRPKKPKKHQQTQSDVSSCSASLDWGVNTCTGKSLPHHIKLLDHDPPVLPSKLSPVFGNQYLHNHHRPSRPTARVLNTKQGAANKPIALCFPQLTSLNSLKNTPGQHKHEQACQPVI